MIASQRRAIAIALGLLALVAPGCRRDEAAQPAVAAAPVAPPVNGHIDPVPYRVQIEATEALLYAPAAPGDEDWRNLSRALLELHNAIVFRDTSPEARETSRRLFFLSAEVDAVGKPKHAEERLAAMRGVWEKIREEQFAQADWFHAATP